MSTSFTSPGAVSTINPFKINGLMALARSVLPLSLHARIVQPKAFGAVPCQASDLFVNV
jgi:hypothetical protein